MPYRVTCPTCKAVYLIPEDTLGKKLSCQKCRQDFLVGPPKAPLPAPAKPAKPARAARGRTENIPRRPAAKVPPRNEAITTSSLSSGPTLQAKKSSRVFLGAIVAIVLVLGGSATGIAVTALYYRKHQEDAPIVQTATNQGEQERSNAAAKKRNEQAMDAKDPAQEPNENASKLMPEANPSAPLTDTPSSSTPGGPTVKGLPPDLDRVPRDAMVFCSLRVAETLKLPVAAGLRKQLQQEPSLNSYRLLLGLGIEDIDRVVVVFQALKPEVEGVALVTTVKPYDRERLLSFIAPEKEEMKVGTATFYASKKSPAGIHFLNDRTFIVGLGKEVKKFLERPNGRDDPGPLSDVLASAARTHTVVFGARPALMTPIEKKDVPPPYQAYLPLLEAHSATLTLNAGKDLGLEVRLAFANEEQAKKGEKAAKEAVAFASLVMRQFPPMLEKIPAPEFKPMIPKVRGLIEAIVASLVETPPRRESLVVVHSMRIQSPDWFNAFVEAAPFLAPRPAKSSPGPALAPPSPAPCKKRDEDVRGSRSSHQETGR